MHSEAQSKKRGRGGEEDADASSKRPKRKQRVSVSSVRMYFAGPGYSAASDIRAGGNCSSATLGPNCLRSMGSDADPSKPAGITAAKKKYPGKSFKAGHLLNADFGGLGDNSKNLTILTAKANSLHKNFDNPIKEAVGELKKLYEVLSAAYFDVTTLRYGIEVSVSVSSQKWGDKPPDKYICNSLLCTAATDEEPDLGSLRDVAGEPLDDQSQRQAQALIAGIDHLVALANRAGVVGNTA